MDSVTSEALIRVTLAKKHWTVSDVRDWLAEVDRLRIPNRCSVSVLDGCITLVFSSTILDETFGESQLGVEGYDILVGLPR
jgi:hypothetical protein